MSDLKPIKLTAGYGEKKITPWLGIELAGYGFYLDRKAESILDDLKVRVLFLRHNRECIILISCDLIGFSVDFSDKVRQEVASGYNLSPQNVLLACTHTHSGPATQPRLGLGEIDPNYMAWLSGTIKEAVGSAMADLKEVGFSFSLEAIEPIGFNRRKRNFEDIDPMLKMAVFKQDRRKIYLLNYACHPVVLGPTKEISADWPGALISEIETRGSKAIFLQGFCGDIDPVTNMNRWGKGRKEDLILYGKILSQRAFKAEKYTPPSKGKILKVVEKRIKLPLEVCRKSDIEKETKSFLESNKGFPSAERLIEEWKKKAYESHAAFIKKPYIENVPIHVVSIGNLNVLGLPGEVFCRIGLKLQKKWRTLFTLGYANGNIGYLPTRAAYRTPDDYACYSAPKFSTVFPFSPKIEEILVKESNDLLSLCRSDGMT